ncbi:MAG: hypothetical protein AABP62_26490 [Planctomycetota bacterium]
MEDKSRGWLFRKRNVLGAALVAGIIAGVYLPDFWNGFGGGSITGVGIGDPAGGTKGEPSDNPAAKPVEDDTKPLENVPPVIRVVIDDRSYFIRSADGDRPVEIAEVIALAKAAAGDADGIRVKVYRKGTSRPTAENALQDAFNDAKISDNAVFWVPTTTE